MSLLSTLQQLCNYDTALLANTIGFIDPTPAQEFYMSGVIQSDTPTLGPTVGVAVTCEVATSTPNQEWDFDTFYDNIFPVIERSKEPVVLVLKSVGTRPEHECVMGDGLAKMLNAVGCIGLVTDGRVRDVEAMLSVPFATYSRGRCIHHCAWRFTRPNLPVEIGGITISPGEVIHANIGGVLKIPSGCLEILPERAAAMHAFEDRAHCVNRITGLHINEKRRQISRLLEEFGFKSLDWTRPHDTSGQKAPAKASKRHKSD
jgi:4-hydroxy-4-methyl-2-oxoglutarate aldolase